MFPKGNASVVRLPRVPVASKLLSNKENEKFAMLMWDDGKSVRRTFEPNGKKPTRN